MVDRFAAMRSFRTVVERGGFASAARMLGLSNATVSKQVSMLEAHLGARLLHRTTRRLSLTEAGRGFYADTVRILDDLAGAATRVVDGQAEPRGLLRINAPLSFSVSRLMPVIARFMATHPRVRVDLVLDDRAVDPVGGAFDVTLRIRAALDDSDLVARRIGPIAHAVCVSSAYPKAFPVLPEDLLQHRMLVYGRDGAGEHSYRFSAIGGRGPAVDVQITPALRANNSLALRGALLAGAGVAVIPRFVVQGDLEAGRLTQVLPAWALPDHALFALLPSGRALPAKVRRFLDLLIEERESLTDAQI